MEKMCSVENNVERWQPVVGQVVNLVDLNQKDLKVGTFVVITYDPENKQVYFVIDIREPSSRSRYVRSHYGAGLCRSITRKCPTILPYVVMFYGYSRVTQVTLEYPLLLFFFKNQTILIRLLRL